MMNKKIGIFVLFFVIISSMLGTTMVYGRRPPEDPPPPSSDISGYIKDSETYLGISGAIVYLYGYDPETCQIVSLGLACTDANGKYDFWEVSLDGPYELEVWHSMYYTYSGPILSTIYLTTKYCDLRVTGTVIEDQTIDGIKSPNSVDLTLNIKPYEGMVYDFIITSTPVYINVYHFTGLLAKKVLVSANDGSYDTGTFPILKGTVTIKACTRLDPHATECYQSKTTENYINTSTTLNGIDFCLERKQGLVSAYGDDQIREEMMNFYLKLSSSQPSKALRINLESRCTPQLLYDPKKSESYNYLETSYELTTWDFYLFGHYYCTPRYITQHLYVYNHWTGDESIIALEDLDFGITQTGYYSKFQWTMGPNVGLSSSRAFGSVFSVSAISAPPDSIQIGKSALNQDQVDGRYLGYVSFDYTNAQMDYLNTMSTVWHLKIDNSHMKSVKQCGAHFTFKIVTDINYQVCRDFFGNNQWIGDLCTFRFEQTLGNGPGYVSDPPHPTVTLLDGSYLQIQNGEMHGYDLWMNLLPAEIYGLSI